MRWGFILSLLQLNIVLQVPANCWKKAKKKKKKKEYNWQQGNCHYLQISRIIYKYIILYQENTKESIEKLQYFFIF